LIQALVDEEAYVPATHELEHKAEKLVADTEYVPGAQDAVTALRPVVAQYDPAVQGVHIDNPEEDAKYPAKQSVHVLLPASEYFPAEQDEVAA